MSTMGLRIRAVGGTLFIGENDRLSFKTQACLLYLLDERRYRALGASVSSVLPPCSLRSWLHPSP